MTYASSPSSSRASPLALTGAGYTLIALSVLGFSHKGVFFAQLLPRGLSGLDVSAVRWIASLPVVWLVYRFVLPPDARRLPRGRALALFGASAALSAACSALHTQSFVYLDASVAGVAIFVYPAFSVIAGAVRHRRGLTPSQWAQLALLGSALWLLAVPGDRHTPRPNAALGFALCMAAAVLWVVYLNLTAGLLRKPGTRTGIHPITFTFLTSVVTAGYGAVHIMVFDPELPAPALADPFWPLVAGLALVASTVPGMAMYAGLARVGATRGGFMMAMSPGTSAVLAAYWLDEPLGPLRILGVVLITIVALPLWRR